MIFYFMRRGMSTVGVVLIILLTIVAAGIFLSTTLKSIRESTAQEKAKCLGIDLKNTQCVIFPTGYTLPNSNYALPVDGIYAIVERAYGGGEIRDLRFDLTYSSGRNEILKPVNISGAGYKIETGYNNFLEHSSKEVALMPVTYNPPSEVPYSLRVSAVVGKRDTICEPTSEPLPCSVYST